MKFTTKLFLLYLGFTLGIIIPICSFLFYATQQAMTAQINKHLQERASHWIDKLDHLLFERFSDIQMLAKQPLLSSPQIFLSAVTEHLLSHQNYYKFYLSVSLVDANRIRIADTLGQSLGQVEPPSRWVTEVYEQGLVSVGADIHWVEELQSTVIFFAAPVRDVSGQFKGAVVARLPIERLNLVFGESKVQPKTSLQEVLIDNSGKVLYANHPLPSVSPTLWKQVVQSTSAAQLPALLGPEALYTIVHEPGYLDFPGNQWTLLVYYPLTEVLAKVTALRHQTWLLGSGMLLLSLGGLIFLARRMVRPLLLLQTAAVKLGQGDFNTTVTLPHASPVDEIAQLGLTFNQMARRLKQQLVELQSGKDFLRLLIDTLPQIIFWKDVNGVYLGCNQAAATLAGQASPDGLIGKRDFELPWHTQVAKIYASDRLVIAQNLPQYHTEETIVAATGEARYLQITKVPLHDVEGKVIGVLGTAQDITSRKQADLNLQEALQALRRFKLTLDIIDLVVLMADAHTKKIFYVNQGALAHLGYTTTELYEMTPLDFEPEMTPAQFDQLLAPLLTGEKTTLVYQTQHRSKFGVFIPVEVYLQYVEVPGQVNCLIEIVRDITDRKQVEQEREHLLTEANESKDLLRIVLDATPDWIFAKNTNFRYILVNQGFANTVGLPIEEILDKTDLELGFSEKLVFGDPAQGIRGFRHDDQAVLTTGQEIRNTNDPATFADGTVHLFDTRKLPLRNARGQVFAVLGFARDLTERRQFELDLERAKEAAEAANRAKSSFLANMSHELRTPLNGILGYAQIFNRDKSFTPKQREGIEIIQRSGEYLLTLINDILDFSKLETGRLELTLSDFHFSSFLDNLISLFKLRAAQKGLAFVYEPLSALPVGIRADERRLRQILVNLLSNAFKFTEQGGITFRVSYVDHQVLFEIIDTGIGIAATDLTRLFLPFQQLERRNCQTEGTGLGLSITKKLVETMAGELRVESTIGSGSHFWVKLPLPEVSTLGDLKTKPPAIITGFEGPPRKILVIDDKAENRAVLVNLLTPLGFTVVEASDGQIGLTQMETELPDLILTDLVMPHLDGFELLRRLRKMPAFTHLPVIAISASVFDFNRQVSMETGYDDFLPKPIKAEELLERISFHLGLHWIYEQTTPSTATANQSVPDTMDEIVSSYQGPSPEQAAILLDVALMGDINGIMEELDELVCQQPTLEPFANYIRKLAKNFEEKKICEILEKYK